MGGSYGDAPAVLLACMCTHALLCTHFVSLSIHCTLVMSYLLLVDEYLLFIVYLLLVDEYHTHNIPFCS